MYKLKTTYLIEKKFIQINALIVNRLFKLFSYFGFRLT